MYDIAEKFQLEDINTGTRSNILNLPELIESLMAIYYPDISSERRNILVDAVNKAYNSLPNTDFKLADQLILRALV